MRASSTEQIESIERDQITKLEGEKVEIRDNRIQSRLEQNQDKTIKETR